MHKQSQLKWREREREKKKKKELAVEWSLEGKTGGLLIAIWR